MRVTKAGISTVEERTYRPAGSHTVPPPRSAQAERAFFRAEVLSFFPVGSAP